VFAVADDLSGAAEVAVAFGGRSRLALSRLAGAAAGEAVVLDLNSRQLPAEEAASAVRDALRAFPPGAVAFKKVDSLLRGNLAAEAAAWAEGSPGMLVATALPVAGRTVRNGVVHLDGVPLHRTSAWRAEDGRTAPGSVCEALTRGGAPLRTRLVPLATIRAGAAALAAALDAAAAYRAHPVCDAETDRDLDAIAAAGIARGLRLLGTAGLAAAVGRVLGRGGGMPAGPPPAPVDGSPSRPLLVVVGTAEPGAGVQIAHLLDGGPGAGIGAVHTAVAAEALLGGGCALPAPAPGRTTVVSIDGSRGISTGAGRAICQALARAVAPAAAGADLVLTGGETARRVLDALGARELRPVGQVHHGAVVARLPDGRFVVTRPGSYGGADSLSRIVRALREPSDVPSTTGVPQ
jgi:4-hydroxythreonine-4-phosphate dehydrogenase